MSQLPNSTPALSPSKAGSGKSRVVRNVFSNWGSYAVAMGVNFFLSPYVVHHLGNTGYGVWTLILSLTGYLGLLDLGIRGAVTRYIAKFHTQGDHSNASQMASSAMVIFGTAGIIAIAASFIFALYVIHRFPIPVQYLIAARVVVMLTGLSVATSLVNGVFGGALVGLQRFDLTNSIEVGINFLRAATIVLVLHLGFGVFALACIQLAFTLTRWFANMALAHFLYPELKIRLSLARRAGVMLILSYSVFSFLLQISSSLIYLSDNMVIGAYASVALVTFYAIGGNLIEYTRTVVTSISQTMTPLTSSIEAENDQERLRRAVLLGGAAGTMVMLPIAVTFMLRGASFIGLWMGPQYTQLSGKVLWVLSLTLLFWAANAVTAGSLLGVSKHKWLVPATAVEGICNLALSIHWVKTMGIVGVAWGTVVPSVASHALFWPWYIRRSFGIRPLTYISSVWVRPAIAILPFAAGSYAVERYAHPAHLLVFFLQVALVLPLAAIGYWLVCLDRPQRESCSRQFSQSFERVFVRG